VSIFLTSDTHFGHDKIIEYCKRPFSDSKEMDEVMIRNWNLTVNPADTVYHLGDFGVGKEATPEYLEIIYKELNGTIKFVKGNHDHGNRITKLGTDWSDYRELKVGGKLYVLFHYPMHTWKNAIHGSYHCFGHVHGTFKGVGKSLDVGVDCWNFSPVSLEEIDKKLESITVVQTI
jgi:calcineurin-like phosphoesterase family protein